MLHAHGDQQGLGSHGWPVVGVRGSIHGSVSHWCPGTAVQQRAAHQLVLHHACRSKFVVSEGSAKTRSPQYVPQHTCKAAAHMISHARQRQGPGLAYRSSSTWAALAMSLAYCMTASSSAVLNCICTTTGWPRAPCPCFTVAGYDCTRTCMQHPAHRAPHGTL